MIKGGKADRFKWFFNLTTDKKYRSSHLELSSKINVYLNFLKETWSRVHNSLHCRICKIFLGILRLFLEFCAYSSAV